MMELEGEIGEPCWELYLKDLIANIFGLKAVLPEFFSLQDKSN